MRALSPAARQGVIELMNSHGGQIRGQMAHQAARGELEASEREAFRTLAAASPEIRSHGSQRLRRRRRPPSRCAAPSTSTASQRAQAGARGTALPVRRGRRRAASAAPASPTAPSSIPPARGGNGSDPPDGGAR